VYYWGNGAYESSVFEALHYVWRQGVGDLEVCLVGRRLIVER
jgi:hypothetical protein